CDRSKSAGRSVFVDGARNWPEVPSNGSWSGSRPLIRLPARPAIIIIRNRQSRDVFHKRLMPHCLETAMQSHEVLREAAEKVGVKALAAELKLSPALIYKWCEEADPTDPDASGARNPLDRVRDIVRLTGHIEVVSWLCEQADGFFAR